MKYTESPTFRSSLLDGPRMNWLVQVLCVIAIRIPSGLHGSGWRYGQTAMHLTRLKAVTRAGSNYRTQAGTARPSLIRYLSRPSSRISVSPPVSEHCSLAPA